VSITVAPIPHRPLAAPRPEPFSLRRLGAIRNTPFLFLNVAVALVARVVVALELKVLPANLASEWKYKLKSAGFRSGWGDA
jgi:hypothetical protein